MTSVHTPTTDDTLHLPMPTRDLGRTGHHASLYSLGGVKWDTQLDEADAVALIHRAIDLGVNCIDTASGYGGGQSEKRLGLALKDRRSEVFLSTKSGKRDYDEARKSFDQSLERLQTDCIDLMFIHGLDDEDDYAKVMGGKSILQAMEEYRDAGHIRFLGVSGHWFRHSMRRIIDEYPFDAILCPVGLFNVAYGYNYFDDVIPEARQRGIAVMGMKIFGAGRVKHAADIEPYLRYTLNQPIDTAVIGCDSIGQLERALRIVKARPPALPEAEQSRYFDEIMAITQQWDKGEFNWVEHYVK